MVFQHEIENRSVDFVLRLIDGVRARLLRLAESEGL